MTDTLDYLNRINHANKWLHSTQGEYVFSWEQKKISTIVNDIFGFYAIQIGFPSIDLLVDNRIPTRICISIAQESGQICCDPHHLPFAEQSIDLIVLPHILEFSPDPHQVLREIERVLIPEGQVIITGFNPVSLWGVKRHWQHWGHRDKKGLFFPWDGEYLTPLRLRDWLSLLGFIVEGGSFGCFLPPCMQKKWLQRFAFMEKAGDRWWGISGGVYLLKARKRVVGMHLLRPIWRDRKAKEKSLVPVTPK